MNIGFWSLYYPILTLFYDTFEQSISPLHCAEKHSMNTLSNNNTPIVAVSIDSTF